MSARTAILYIAPWAIPGGSDKGTVDWFRTLDRTRFEAHLITTNAATDNAFVPDIEPWAEAVWNLPDLLQEPQFGPFVLDYVGRCGIDVVHIMNSQLGFDLIPFLAARHPRVAVVVQQHAEEHDESLYVRYLASRYGHLVDAYSATSEDLKRRIVGYGVDPAKVEVIYTGIDGELEWVPDPRPRRERADVADPLRVLYPGRLEDQKDPHLMVEVALELQRRAVPVRIDVLGEGSLRPELEARVARAGLGDRVRFHGVRHDMRVWYQQAEAMLMTSRYEGIPYVIFEAMAMALPVVVPDVNANAELVDDEVGVLVRDRADVGSYAGALEALAHDPDLGRSRGERARRRVLDRFGLAVMAQQHRQLYLRLLSIPHREGPS